jgi:hydroxymethylpyrimidine pyrophosphatase-like HAD family hydrolase
MWPVNGVVGENGAFYFSYDAIGKKMIRRYFKTEGERKKDISKLIDVKEKILKSIPGVRISADQSYREADLAVDFAEDVPLASDADIKKIVDIFEQNGATAKISSIHVNGWFGSYDKLTMTKIMFKEIFNTDLDAIKENVIYAGDSPNDEPMFQYFPNSVGVANIMACVDQLVHKPSYITEDKGGIGFAQLKEILIR